MRPVQTFVFCIILCSSTLIAENSVEQKSSQLGLDELISKMNRAKATERFKYMNKIKEHLKKMNADQRIKEINKLQHKINASKAALVPQMRINKKIPEVKKIPLQPAMPSAVPMQAPANMPNIPSIPVH